MEPKLHFGMMLLYKGLDPRESYCSRRPKQLNGTEKVSLQTCR
jgi:hypothetical protein